MTDLNHGGALDEMKIKFPKATRPWVDLSTGINPWPYPAMPAIGDVLTRLPIRSAVERCRSAMATAFTAPIESVLLSPGSELLIRLLPNVLTVKRVAILSPGYGDHELAWRGSGADVILTADPLAYADQVDAVVLSQPNNPDGRLFSQDDLFRAHQELARRGRWLIVDEAYADLTPGNSLAPKAGAAGLIIFRSFGKFFGLAGVRLGALLGPPDVLEAMSMRLGCWPVSGLALELGATAYEDVSWQADARSKLAQARLRLDRLLSEAGYKIAGGTDLFRLIETSRAHAVFERLAQSGFYVRRFAWSESHLRFGLPSDRTAERRLIAALTLSA